MTFEPTSLYQEFEEAFEAIQAPVSVVETTTRKQGKVVKVNFQRYDDGWHIESIDQ